MDQDIVKFFTEDSRRKYVKAVIEESYGMDLNNSDNKCSWF
jgi:hypothetical protein